ncbi:MAG: hypothetical protein AAB889_02890, partial [Patescibacteria group bacterium]
PKGTTGLFVDATGQVGVGTTSPSQALHVVGQCVTGDTLLKRRRRRKGKNGEWIEDWEDVRIDEIEAGDEILTLDEKTGKFIPSIVEKLMDMRIQEVFELVTGSGKRIETTGNHPYLVRDLFKKNNISQQGSNDRQGKGDNDSGVNINEIDVIFHSNVFSFTAANKNSMAQMRSNVNTKILTQPLRSVKLGAIIVTPNQPADTFINKSESADTQTASNVLIENTLTKSNSSVNGQWMKVVYLNVGDEIATLDGWEEIVSIRRTGRKQVYDIQVANTHNFVGNGIVAHNTYINSTATTANIKGLEIAQSGAVVGTGYGLYAAKTGASTTNVGGYFSATGATNNYGLIVDSGSVGIGTTSPLTKLHVEGACVTGDTKIKRRRRRRRPDGTWEDEWEDIPITDIEPGDEILTLDERTGKFVVSTVRQRMNMGRQKTFEIIAQSGKSIRTTAKHPYLVNLTKEENLNTNALYHKIFENAQSAGRQFYREMLEGTSVRVPAIDNELIFFGHEGWNHLMQEKRSRFDLLTRFFALPKILVLLKLAKKARKEIAKVDKHITFWTLQGIVDGVWIRVVIRSVNNGPKYFYSVIWKGEESRSEVKAAIKKGAVSRLYPRRQASGKTLAFSTDLVKELSLARILTGRRRRLVTSQLFYKLNIPVDESRVKWVRVSHLKIGQNIATCDGWERIIAIRQISEEQVYDLEIENTHNFVGNGIVAHNTTGKALSIFNETGDQAIFTASASGTPVFTLGRTGILSLNQNSQLNTAGTLLLNSTGTFSVNTTNNQAITTGTGITTLGGNLVLNNSASTTTFGGSAYAWPTSGQSSNYVLTTNGTSTLSWNDPNVLAASTIFWNQTNGLLFPKNSTVDVTIGGQATSSAKFAFLNVAAGTPTASVSAGAAGATYITAGGVIATTAKQSLTLGDSNTGNIQFYSASNSLTSAGNLTLAGTISLPNTNTLTGVSSYVNVNNGIGFGSTTGAPTYYINNLGTGNLNALTLAGNLTLNGNVASHLIPSATTTYDLGSTTRYWQNAYLQNLYVSGNYSGFWQRFNGALSPTNITDDLLVGATATPSASTTNYFQVLGTGSTQGDATTSGVLTLGTNRSTATIGTQRMIPLTLGSSTTGPIQLSPKGTTGLFVD